MRRFSVEDLPATALGAAFLGTGGGGDPYVGSLLARQAILENGPITVLDLAEVPDDAFCAMSAIMGAPTVLVEKLPGGEEQLLAFRALEKHLGRDFTHLISAEVGGLNSMLPIAAAAVTGLPLIDCDAMGRAFPEIQMSTPTLHDIRAAPMAIADDKGNTVVVDAVNNQWTEQLARSVTIDMGASSFIALYPQSGVQVRMSMIGGTLTLAQSIGAAILEARNQNTDPVDAGIRAAGGGRLFEGKITDVDRRTEAGFSRGEVTIVGSGSNDGETLRIEFQNENLIAVVEDKVLASVPDLITVLESDSGRPVTTEELHYGYRVSVAGVPCDPQWRTSAGLDLVGPGYFGYDITYAPLDLDFRPNGSRL